VSHCLVNAVIVEVESSGKAVRGLVRFRELIRWDEKALGGLIEINFHVRNGNGDNWSCLFEEDFCSFCSACRVSYGRKKSNISTSLLFVSARNFGTLQHRNRIVKRERVVLAGVTAVVAWEMVHPTSATRMHWESICCVLLRLISIQRSRS
jgi:hypothetical protein